MNSSRHRRGEPRTFWATLGFCFAVGCADDPERLLRFCESPTNPSAIAASGQVRVGSLGLSRGEDYAPFIISASDSQLELELCETNTRGDWHIMTTWHLTGPAPQTVGTYPPGTYFEGYSRGRLTEGALTHNDFFTAGQEPLALPGSGSIEVYDPSSGHFKATMKIDRTSLGAASLELDISWVPR